MYGKGVIIKMEEILCIVAVITIIVAIITILCYRTRTRRIIKSLDYMIDRAIAGNFTEDLFDESALSSVECKMENYLAASEVSAQNLSIEKDKIKTLISDISHQTKTPIANIQLYSELLLENLDRIQGDYGDFSRENLNYAKLISSQTEKLSFLISSLIKLSRLETGILTVLPKDGEIFGVLERIKAQFSAKAKEKGIDFVVYPTDARAVFDEKWTEEALCNIVDNAIKYTKEGSVTVQVIEYELFTCIQVSDTGIGISEEEQAKIFARFYRSVDVGNSDGIGIGLYLAREIISGQGGYIKAVSEIGKGSVFSIYLPREKQTKIEGK